MCCWGLVFVMREKRENPEQVVFDKKSNVYTRYQQWQLHLNKAQTKQWRNLRVAPAFEDLL